jgi:uncharacterized protein (DUF2237 family)
VNKLLLIRGLGHSGTTILDLALGAHPQMVGLGEAARILERPSPSDAHRGPAQLRGDLRFERRCTCGEVAADCPVWGPVLAWLPEHDDCSLAVKMKRLIAALERAHVLESSSTSWVIDSYQGDFTLPFEQESDLEIRVIHLTRDLRSWVHSRARSGREEGRWLPGLKPMLRWCWMNARHERLLQRCPHPVLRLGYEQLALDPEASLRRICTWLGLEMSEQMLQPGHFSTSHVLSGNRMRFDAKRSAAIRYDASWMAAPTGLGQAALAVPWVAALNRRLVYSVAAEPR